MATFLFTVYADTDDYGLTSTSTTGFQNALDGDSVAVDSQSATTCLLGFNWNGTTYTAYQLLVHFDLSAIPSDASVAGATFYPTRTTNAAVAGMTLAWTVFKKAWSTYGTSEWTDDATSTANALSTSTLTTTAGAPTTYPIALTGWTLADSRLGFWHADGAGGGSANRSCSWATADTSGTTSDPRLEVTINATGSTTVTATGAGSITVGGGTIPSTAAFVVLEVWGAGGVPAAASNQEDGAAAGGYSRITLPVTNGEVIYYSVAAGPVAGATSTADCWIRKGTNSAPTGTGQNGCKGGSAAAGALSAGQGQYGDVNFNGGGGTAKQGGGGSRGGSGGSRSAGPSGDGSAGTAGSGGTGGTGATDADADTGNGGNGGSGGGGTGGTGTQPGGGAGGGGNTGTAGNGAAGQVRISWLTSTPLVVSSARTFICIAA